VAIKRAPVPQNVAEVIFRPNDDESAAPDYPSDLAGVVSAEEWASAMGRVYGEANQRVNKWWRTRGLLVVPLPIIALAVGLALIGTNPPASEPGKDSKIFNIGLAVAIGGSAVTFFIGYLIARDYAATVRQAFVREGLEALSSHGDWANRNIKVALVEESCTAVMHRRHAGGGGGAVVFTEETQVALIRVTVATDRTLHAPMTSLTHGVMPGSLITTPYGQVDVPADCVPTPGCGFVLVSPTNFSSPLNAGVGTGAGSAGFSRLTAETSEEDPPV
jgi:hypothetical protein